MTTTAPSEQGNYVCSDIFMKEVTIKVKDKPDRKQEIPVVQLEPRDKDSGLKVQVIAYQQLQPDQMREIWQLIVNLENDSSRAQFPWMVKIASEEGVPLRNAVKEIYQRKCGKKPAPAEQHETLPKSPVRRKEHHTPPVPMDQEVAIPKRKEPPSPVGSAEGTHSEEGRKKLKKKSHPVESLNGEVEPLISPTVHKALEAEIAQLKERIKEIEPLQKKLNEAMKREKDADLCNKELSKQIRVQSDKIADLEGGIKDREFRLASATQHNENVHKALEVTTDQTMKKLLAFVSFVKLSIDFINTPEIRSSLSFSNDTVEYYKRASELLDPLIHHMGLQHHDASAQHQ